MTRVRRTVSSARGPRCSCSPETVAVTLDADTTITTTRHAAGCAALEHHQPERTQP